MGDQVNLTQSSAVHVATKLVKCSLNFLVSFNKARIIIIIEYIDVT